MPQKYVIKLAKIMHYPKFQSFPNPLTIWESRFKILKSLCRVEIFSSWNTGLLESKRPGWTHEYIRKNQIKNNCTRPEKSVKTRQKSANLVKMPKMGAFLSLSQPSCIYFKFRFFCCFRGFSPVVFNHIKGFMIIKRDSQIVRGLGKLWNFG